MSTSHVHKLESIYPLAKMYFHCDEGYHMSERDICDYYYEGLESISKLAFCIGITCDQLVWILNQDVRAYQ